MSSRGRLFALVLGSVLWTAPLIVAAAPGRQSPPAEDIRDIRGPISIPPWWRWLALGGGGALVVGLGAVATVLIRRRRSKPLEPYERALERLKQAQPLIVAGQPREYAAAASDAIREYLEESFGLPAAHATTEEFFEALIARQQPLLGDQQASLLQFLKVCDLAKFARFPLPREGMASLNDLARTFVLTSAHQFPDPQRFPARTP